MQFNEYQEIAISTAIYPERKSFFGLLYTTLKMNGEAGEAAEKVGKWWRDQNGLCSADDVKALAKELGDVLWYIAASASELDMTLDEIAQLNIEKITSRRARNVTKGSGDDR